MNRCAVDYGRTAVYEAEEAAFGGTTLDDAVGLAELAARAQQLVTGSWWLAAGGPAVEVIAARSGARASTARPAAMGRVGIRIADGHSSVATLAHELAHALAGVIHSHDEQFRAAHADVVTMIAGTSAGKDLVDAYRRFGLRPGDRSWPAPMRPSGADFIWSG